MNHLDEKIMLRYVSGGVSEDEMIEVDAHIVDCPECLMRIKALRYLQQNFDSVWESWTPEEHGRVYRRWQLVTALENVSGSPKFSEQARRWIEQIEERAEAVVKVLHDRTRDLAMILAAFMPHGHSFALASAILDVGDHSIVRDQSNKESEGVYVMGLAEVLEPDVRISEPPESEIRREDSKVIKAVVESCKGVLSVKLWPSKTGIEQSVVLLIPAGKPDSVLVTQFEPVEDADYLLAEFRDVPTGQFDIVWRPCS